MLAPYRSVLATPEAARFLSGSLVARLGGAMFGVAIVAMVAERRGSYSLAGAVSATGLVVLAATAAVIGRLVDRFGQRRVTLPLVLWDVCWNAALVISSIAGAPAWTLFLAYAMSAIVPAPDAMSRARWIHLLDGQPERLHTAMSLEQVLDEFAFVVGPAVAVMLATTVTPEAGFIAASVLNALGTVLFVSARSSEPPVQPKGGEAASSVVGNAAVIVVALIMVLTGGLLGANDVVTLAFAAEHGHADLAGIILALFALGSGTAAVVFGARETSGRMSRALLLGTIAMCVLEVPVLFVDNLTALAVVLLIAGAATAPTLITTMKLAQVLVRPGQVNESMGVVFTGLIVGVAAGSAVSGSVVERWDAHTAYAVPVLSGAGAIVLAALAFRLLRRSQPAVVPSSE
ncbi:MFS transporter [Flexivirga oryzae]|uniref:MFS family permease n=1 Tax=Flexivirga oryzae TaxID=1794944 RepID=A0A839N6C0_9MICO|nr:MFS family permease [Flexivirga oryzae]